MGDSRDLAIRLRRLRSVRGALAVVVALAAALAVVLLAASASPARADRGSGPVAVAAFGSSGGTEVATNTIPGGGEGTVQTDQLPASATQASIQTAPMNPSEAGFDGLVDTVVTNYPQFAKVNRTAQRIITCAIIAAVVGSATTNKYGDYEFTETDPTYEALALDMCLRIALNISAPSAAGAAISASAGCHSGLQALAIRITKTSSGYSGRVKGRTHRPRGRSPLAISCQRTATGLQLTVRPRAKGSTLVQAAGPTLGVAFVNPSTKSVGVRVTFTVK
jgi:hypothetical protein